MTSIITFPDERLEQVAAEVPLGERVREIIDAMEETLKRSPNGIGLAAPQIGVMKRIILVRVPIRHFQTHGVAKHLIINPQIVWRGGAKELGWEGCLSFPDKQVKIPRWPRIQVIGYDHRWEPIKIGAKGLVARCIQHEIDHLDGRNLAYYARLAHEAEQEALAKKQAEEADYNREEVDEPNADVHPDVVIVGPTAEELEQKKLEEQQIELPLETVAPTDSGANA